MTVGERLKECRFRQGLSQEKVAELLGVSRQAVTKWESGKSLPSSENLLALASLYGVSLDKLAGAGAKEKQDRTILHKNLTLLAIICQAAALNVCIQPMPPSEYGLHAAVILAVKLIPLAACSIWMAFNLNYEKDLAQRRENNRIELCYCLLQAVIAWAGFRFQLGMAGTLAVLGVCLVYIFVINPKYMRRTLFRQTPRH